VSLGTSTTVNNADGGVILARRSPRIVWQRQIVRDYGAFQGAHGIGSSLAQTSDAVFVLVQHGGPSYLLAVDKTDGRTRFKLDRPEKAAWTTPILSRSNGREEILVSANGRVAAIDAASGKEIWQVTGVPRNLISSPSATKEMVVVGAMEKTGSIAIARDGNGDVTQTHVLWTADATADYASPLVTDACVYFINQAGGLTCADPKTGAALWKYRLPGEAWASPVVRGNHVYVFTKLGTTVVLEDRADQAVEIATGSIVLLSLENGSGSTLRLGRSGPGVGQEHLEVFAREGELEGFHETVLPLEAVREAGAQSLGRVLGALRNEDDTVAFAGERIHDEGVDEGLDVELARDEARSIPIVADNIPVLVYLSAGIGLLRLEGRPIVTEEEVVSEHELTGAMADADSGATRFVALPDTLKIGEHSPFDGRGRRLLRHRRKS